MMNITDAGFFEALKEIKNLHARDTKMYKYLEALCIKYFKESDLKKAENIAVPFGSFGTLVMPYKKMGAIDSLDLFGLDELIIFSFYWANKGRYKKTVDIGANLGLHSILMAKAGFNVTAYEPDDFHYDWLNERVKSNGVADKINVVKAAISDKNGQMEFIRVEGNTTGSHLAGAKANPYGDLTKYMVDVHAISDVAATADFMKIDAEGHECVILNAIPTDCWKKTDAIVEIGTPENAKEVFTLFDGKPVNLFAQKKGWGKVNTLAEMPTSYKEGSLFISSKAEMPW